jgi:hypothetical protein
MTQAAGGGRAVTSGAGRARTGLPRRLVLTAYGLLPAACCLLGCATFGPMHNTGGTSPAVKIDRPPEPQQVIAFLNRNAAQISAIESQDLDLDIKVGTGIGQQFGVSGSLYCQKPRNFRLRAKTIGSQVADIGSNAQEFWTWNREERPPALYYCTYDSLARGNVPLPFPVQPEWVLEVLGMATLNPNGNFTIAPFDVKRPPQTLELVERTTGPGGQPVAKVTVMTMAGVSGKTPQVVAHRLYDARSRLLCEARVISVHREATGNGPVEVPHELELRFPGQQPSQTMTMKLKLDGFRLNGDAPRNPRLYEKPSYEGVPSIDLARGLPPAAPTAVQRTGGWGR